MLNVLFNVGMIKVYSFGVLAVLGFLAGLFVIWKKAQEYHLDNKAFFDIYCGIFWGGVVIGRLVYIAFHFNDFGLNVVKWLWLTHYVGISFWGALLGMVVILWWMCREVGADYYKHLDLLSLGLSLGLFFGNLAVILNGDYRNLIIQLIVAILMLGLFIWLWWLEQEYRTISWYRGTKNSAQTGFLWFWWMIWLGLISAIADLLSGKMDGYIGLGVMLIGVIGIYHRSGRNLKGDWLDLRKRIGLN